MSEPEQTQGRIASAKARMIAAKDSLYARRGTYRPLDVALSMSERDLATGGGLLAGALAFRLFLWTLPAALLGVGVLGFRVDTAGADAAKAGLSGFAAETIEQAAIEAHHGRWFAVIFGGAFLVTASLALARTIKVAAALTWSQPIRKFKYPLRAAAATSGALVLAFGGGLLANYLRERSSGLGLTTTLGIMLFWIALWWAASFALPHPGGLPWWGLAPGAILVGVGAQALHLATVYYFSAKISAASSLYGSLGAAATLLLWAYVISRLLLGSAALNVTVLRIYGHDPTSRDSS